MRCQVSATSILCMLRLVLTAFENLQCATFTKYTGTARPHEILLPIVSATRRHFVTEKSHTAICSSFSANDVHSAFNSGLIDATSERFDHIRSQNLRHFVAFHSKCKYTVHGLVIWPVSSVSSARNASEAPRFQLVYACTPVYSFRYVDAILERHAAVGESHSHWTYLGLLSNPNGRSSSGSLVGVSATYTPHF